MQDIGVGQERINIGSRVVDQIKESARWRILKFKNPEVAERVAELSRQGVPLEELGTPDEVLEFRGNCLLNEGINELWKLACGDAGATPFDNAHAHIGVGDSSTNESAFQDGLQGTHKEYKEMDSGFPTYGTNQKAVFRATFGSDEANFAWEEVTVANGNSDDAINLNRKVQTMGTKASGTTWVVTLEIVLS